MSLNTVTITEAKVLRAVPELDSAIPYELANPTQMTPTEINAALSRLVAKGLVERAGDGGMIKLTGEGRRVHRLLERPQKRQWSAMTEGVLVVPDEESARLEGDPTTDIDAALDAEISSMTEASR